MAVRYEFIVRCSETKRKACDSGLRSALASSQMVIETIQPFDLLKHNHVVLL